ncbi:MAG TPA: Tad domain-containing protein [Anaerolineales bacterium]|nr:Tad domain-containing protein [Anaerolineales bacterium]
MIFKTTQKGQALILIALAAVGLFGFAALALDGSAVFADRRHAQNAADTGAYAAALARIRGKPEAEWKQAGLDRVGTNGYTDNGEIVVKVYSCLEWKTSPDNPTGADCKALPAGADPDEYVLVRVRSVVKMYFARVIGRQEVINYSDAIVRAAPANITEWFNGHALVSANPGCAAPGEFGPFEVGGNGNTVVNNSGIFVNSSCPLAFVDNGNSNTVLTDPSAGVCVVGGVQPGVTGVNPAPAANCGDQIDINQFWMPDSDPSLLAPYCSTPGTITSSGGDYIATPGYFNKTGNKTFPDVSPARVLKLQKGIYCLYNGIGLTGNWTITSDLDGDGHESSEGVFFYVPGGDVVFNGGSELRLYAMDSTSGGFPSQLLDYLFYIPASNRADVKITGSNNSTFTGMILAPTSAIEIIGNGGALSLHTQIIGHNTRISGSGNIEITYDPNDVPPAIIPPRLSPTE